MRRALAAAAAARRAHALRRGAGGAHAVAAQHLHSGLSSHCAAAADDAPPEVMPFDVCIVGAGPAGLAAAIRIRQLSEELKEDVSVCVLEKGAEVGAHSLSGNVFETRALDELIPDWRARGAPVEQPATSDAFYLLTPRRGLRLPTPPQQHNAGNFVISLSQLTRWLAAQAEELGALVLPGFPAAALLHADGAQSGGALPPLGPPGSVAPVVGVATSDAGVGRDGSRTERFARGAHVRARATLLAEGARGHLSETAISSFGLRAAVGADPQTYALGIKEVWRVPPAQHTPGRVWHTVGYPLDRHTYGGGFLYHMGAPGLVSLGLVVALDYSNPYLSPYQEFQRWKAHPAVSAVLAGGTPVEYGARALVEGGAQALPALAFPGGALLGDAAGTLNVPKIKGTHTAMKSGELAGESAFAAVLHARRTGGADALADMGTYPQALRASWVWQELQAARNIRPGFRKGLWPGIAHAAVDTYLFRGRAPWTLRHSARGDHAALAPAAASARIMYPPPDGRITFDVPTSLARSGTDHAHDQPAHLRLRDAALATAVNRDVYDGPEGRYCPAGVYEWVVPPEQAGRPDAAPQLVINAQNCLHCKACDIKDPMQNIKWTPPEGDGGPSYTLM